MQACAIIQTKRWGKKLTGGLQSSEKGMLGTGAMRLILKVLEKTANEFSGSYRKTGCSQSEEALLCDTQKKEKQTERNKLHLPSLAVSLLVLPPGKS